MSNFEFLKNEYPEFAELGAIAEELIDTDAASCLTKLRLIAEYIAKDIYFRYFHEKSCYEKQIDLLKELEPYIDSKYMDVFHIIRKKGNSATHSAMLITDVKRDELYHFELVNDKIKTFPVCLNTYATNIVDIGKALFDLEADIGEGSKHEIEAALKGVKEIKQDEKDEESIPLKDQKEKLKELLEQVGPGEWRWKIRSKLNQIDKHENCPYLLDKNKKENQ